MTMHPTPINCRSANMSMKGGAVEEAEEAVAVASGRR